MYLSKKITFLIFLLLSITLFSQDKVIDSFFVAIKNEKFNKANTILNKINFIDTKCNEKYQLKLFLELSKHKGIIEKSKIDSLKYIPNTCTNNIYVEVISKINKGLYDFYYTENYDLSILKIYLDTYNDIKKTNLKELKNVILRRILEYYGSIIAIKNYNYSEYIELYKENATDKKDSLICDFYDLTIGIKNSSEDLNKDHYNSSIEIAKELDISYFLIKLHIISGNYLEHNNKMIKALNFYQKAFQKIKKNKNGTTILSLSDVKLNLGIYYFFNKNFKNSFENLSFLNNHTGKLIKRKSIYFDYWLFRLYENQNDYKKALEHLKKSRTNEYSFKQNEHLNSINDLETKYETEKKEKENLQLKQDNLETEAKRLKNKNYLIGSLLFIFLGSIIGILLLKNSKRKRKLAEQEREIQTQKNLTLLKEQEITNINAMVDGQEKERKRIAEDLHDNLGSVLATLKLHFENLKMNREKKKINQDTLFDKTENLIDEAYLKVRSIAHAKNAGVIANQGLLMAIKMMAEKISSAEKIQIEVVDFGLDKRLENSLEISVFRIIQELITNILKHAGAKNATINVSLYDKNLNIIIEDDGKGFDIKKVNLKNGMGISSIKTRVEHFKGNFKIDSTIGKGSSVIIDIPIE